VVPAKGLDRPKFWIVAGPNGSGKSTVYSGSNIRDFDRSVWIINPDLLTARIQAVEKLSLRKANMQAVERIYTWLEASIAAHQTVGVETVLSTGKYRDLILTAKKRHFEVRLIYVILKSAALNIERVGIRVAEGGHDVPKRKIIERRERSLQQLPWFLEHADGAWLYDNSSSKPRLIGTKFNGQIALASSALPEVRNAVEKVDQRPQMLLQGS
jgi:predicted ABC-type ATPase